MAERVRKARLEIAKVLFELVGKEVLPGTGIDEDRFWLGLEKLVSDLAPKNQQLLETRDRLQAQIDDWHRAHKEGYDEAAYRSFLVGIGYLKPEGPDFKIDTEGVDPEIATIYGPQLVVPVMNARFAINAANARWGSLFDALYGTNVISDSGGSEAGDQYNPVRGAKVIGYSMAFLDQVVPLKLGSHKDVTSYSVTDEGLLSVLMSDGHCTTIAEPEAFCGFQGEDLCPTAILVKHNRLHIEIQIDRSHPVGETVASGIKDILLESAVTAIQDCEDSVAAVDAEDKVLVYKNWLGLIKGDIEETFEKKGRTLTRKLNHDRRYTTKYGDELVLPGRSLMLVRNVGHLMKTDAVLFDGEMVPEGILDALVTAASCIHNIKGQASLANSRTGSIYIVKPKMHGPDEVSFAIEIFARVEQILGLPANTIKIGIMDEERRTTVNLKECIREAKDRIIFINTGFLDRTGDEIHTCMEAGAVVPKGPMKDEAWMAAYEDWNVDIGLACGFRGRAQIGKGMWAKPDEMADMMSKKGEHPKSGANCAWVPSPTAATLHVLHYHDTFVEEVQTQLEGKARAKLDDILRLPLQPNTLALAPEMVQAELENNIQGILGYVVRWIDQGIGCSKVPDINNIGLMEDRATLRISSQHLANWLRHGVCDEQDVLRVMQKMADIVDKQNAYDPKYRKMADDFEGSVAFQAAKDLILKGREQPNGYTEPLLFKRRKQAKAQVT